MEDSNLISKKIRLRYLLVVIVFLSVMMIGIFSTVLHIQFAEGQEWQKWKDKQSRDSVLVDPVRGNIYSADGSLMVASMPTYQVFVDFKVYSGNGKMTERKEREAYQSYRDTLYKYIIPLSQALAAKMGDKPAEAYQRDIIAAFEKGRRDYRISAHKLNYFDLLEVQNYPFFEKGRNRSGMYEKRFVDRTRMFGSLASSTLGSVYAEEERGGASGLELRYDSLLRGQPGYSTREYVAGRYVNVVKQAPVDGWNLHTTIDLAFQDITETALRDMLEQTAAESGTAVLMECQTGRIRAIANLDRMSDGRYAENHNFALQDRSEPGSTFKTIAMMSALEEGCVHPDDPVDVGNGIMRIHGSVMRDHNANHGGYHQITAAKSIWYSSNIGMGLLIDNGFGGRQGAARFVNHIYDMGFNKDLNLEIPGAAHPVIPHPDDERYWSATDLPWMATGYVVAIPPIYTLSYYNAIANDGKYLRPYFVDYIERNGEIYEEFKPQVVTDKICSDKTLKEIRLMLDSVVIKGTASVARSEMLPFSGKTGTAVLSYDMRSGEERGHQVSFCGYFPTQNPEYTCIVVIRRPRIGYPSGGSMSGVVFKHIAEQVYSREHTLEYKRLKPDSLSCVPDVKSGLREPTEELLRKLHQSYKMDVDGDNLLVKSEKTADGVVFEEYVQKEGRVPDVRGLGLRDAISQLEEAGLKVTSNGYGRVVRQSLTPGSMFRSGQEIHLVLNH